MKKILSLVLVACLFALFNVCYVEASGKDPEQFTKEAKASIKEVSIADFKKMLDQKENIIILDVRDKQEFDEGHIPGAINISRGNLEFKVAKVIPDKDARIIVCCGTDRRSPLATKTLNDLGYAHAVNMVGGLRAWKEAGYPTSK